MLTNAREYFTLASISTTDRSKAKQKRFLDKGAGRSLYALQLTENIVYTICIKSIKIINKTSTSYPG